MKASLGTRLLAKDADDSRGLYLFVLGNFEVTVVVVPKDWRFGFFTEFFEGWSGKVEYRHWTIQIGPIFIVSQKDYL